jgi:hypothetical protein
MTLAVVPVLPVVAALAVCCDNTIEKQLNNKASRGNQAKLHDSLSSRIITRQI